VEQALNGRPEQDRHLIAGLCTLSLRVIFTSMIETRTRIMNQLQAVALNEGLRRKKGLWRAA
jgi:hypothetical protein